LFKTEKYLVILFEIKYFRMVDLTVAYIYSGDVPLNRYIREGCDSGKPVMITDPSCPEVRTCTTQDI
jgi:hypothetical protein